MTWLPGWDYLIGLKGWAEFGGADYYVWVGIGCFALLAVFEIIEWNARRKKQRLSLTRSREPSKKLVTAAKVTNFKQSKSDQQKARQRPQRKTA